MLFGQIKKVNDCQIPSNLFGRYCYCFYLLCLCISLKMQFANVRKMKRYRTTTKEPKSDKQTESSDSNGGIVAPSPFVHKYENVVWLVYVKYHHRHTEKSAISHHRCSFCSLVVCVSSAFHIPYGHECVCAFMCGACVRVCACA